jgi:hypothetical protein
MKVIGIVLGLTAAIVPASSARTAITAQAAARDPVLTSHVVAPSSAVTQVAMRNVNFYVTPTAALRIRTLRGTMRSLREGPIVFDDKTSFVIRIAYAEVGLTAPDLSELLNTVVFSYPGAPLKRLKVRMAGTQLIQKGVMHKLVDIPFEITSEPSVTPEGLIRLHPVKTRIFGVNGTGLMRAFGLSLEKILDLSKAKGVRVKGNDFFLDPSKLLPPPAMEGRLAAVRVDGDEIVQTFGTPSAAAILPVPDRDAPAYMFYRGGTLRFGKLLMLDADMQIVALRPAGFFGFDLDRYKQQLVAGYSKTLEDSGLLVYMASVETLSKKGDAQSASASAALH